MKNSLTLLSKIKTQVLLIAAFMFSLAINAQVPRDIPTDTGPLEVDSTFDIILYIVLPIVIIIFFFVYRAAKKKRDREG
ncbi:hypothetical protein KIH41_17460 [Litoribacter ruber]|uniref:Adenylosuccinate synthetase n=1 Tax=Litoribacter ruber TaxID=702568 RepID=A0AAP2CIN4_9BACT|nr:MULTISPECIES: hypothetical protein [Litoribacter]MBS9525448.1 hypothetical protein [Litoribacter alkaliphilus]MBT0813080.1 hypothetical protein [Litoribacter ruber]